MKKILIIATTLFIWSCKTSHNQINLSEKLAFDFPKKEEMFSFNNKRDTILVTESKTRFTIPAFTFCTDNDSMCLSDNIDIKISEYYKVSDMILKRLSTLSNNQIIETAGMFEIVASQNKNYKLNQNNSIGIELPSKSEDGFIYFKGEVKDNNLENWISQAPIDTLSKRKDKIVVAGTTEVVLINKLYNKVINATELGWVNCDKYLSFPDTTTMVINIDKDLPKDVWCSVVMKNYNSIIPGVLENGKIKFSPIPNKEPVIIIVIYHDGDDYYLDMNNVTVAKKGNYNLNPVKVTKQELEVRLSELNKNRNLPL